MISIKERETVLLDGWNEGMEGQSDVVIDPNFWPTVYLLVLHKKWMELNHTFTSTKALRLRENT